MTDEETAGHAAERAAAPAPTAEAEARPARPLTPAAERALREAAERRAAQTRKEAELALQREVNGRGGQDPVRYNDWEIKGLASDF
jgi:hypothetical protein